MVPSMEKLFTSVFLLFLCALCLNAQNNAARDRGVIVVEQRFHGWSHCHLDKTPTFGECNITNDKAKVSCKLTSDKACDTIATAQMSVSEAGEVFLDKEKSQKLVLHVAHDANHIDNSECNYDVDAIKIGFNRSEQYERKSHCVGTKNEGYEVCTNVIVDNPVEIISAKDNSSLCIDNNDKCELCLNDFYVTNQTEFYLSVKLASEGNNSWHQEVRTFKPKQKIELSYDEICSIAGVGKFDWSGKQISIKVTKRLIDGSWSDSNVVLCTFIHKGPDFEIQTVRRTACSDKVELIVKSEKLGEYLKEKFKWAVIHNSTGGGFDCIRAVDRFEATSNMYKLVVENDTLFSRYVLEHPDELKPWFLQLQDKQELGNDSSIAFFCYKRI